ncbi:hypothetical protein [Actinophytocola algeriensis]|uniref:Uncharacterized protein n=1 Tax=Actinophytocola algeriensis TaxID=1768010 RepID=A0A7W7VJ92_9PSEU|nr:hypothetical protein [Actinophytocola algeriensis]MBB4912268.1 hypothetical protein [Actinophytocola algeriensis]MBE1474216.1 hypothetical protein [Actinophytocola algeriensis]
MNGPRAIPLRPRDRLFAEVAPVLAVLLPAVVTTSEIRSGLHAR